MTNRLLLGLACLGTYVGGTSTAHALPPISVPGGESIDIDSEKPDRSGFGNVSGDINDDGDEDLLVAGPVENGVVRAYFGPKPSADIVGEDADAEFVGRADSELGWAMTLADLNADGIKDVVLSAPAESRSWKVGVVYGFYGPIQSASYDLTQADVEIEAPTTTSRHFGWSLATGDFDCDGQDDIAVGDQGDASSNTHVIFETQPGAYQLGTQGTRHAVLQGRAFAGSALAGGDFNGDGCDELAIGAYGEPAYGVANFSGAVFMMYGRSEWEQSYELRDVTDSRLEELQIAVFHDQGRGANVGFSVDFGDHHGDGFDDLIIGAPSYECQGCTGSWQTEGHTFLVQGRLDDISASGEAVPQLLGPFDLRQTDSAVGFEGDATGDLYGFDVAYVGLHHGGIHGYTAAGAPGANKAYLERLPIGLPTQLCEFDPQTNNIACKDQPVPFTMLQRAGDGLQRYDHSDSDSRFGYSVGATRLSGGDDVVVGAPYSLGFHEQVASSGHAYVFFGSGTIL